MSTGATAAQVVNLVSNRVARILGKVENTERFLRLALYQGIPGAAAKAKRAGAVLAGWVCCTKKRRVALCSSVTLTT